MKKSYIIVGVVIIAVVAVLGFVFSVNRPAGSGSQPGVAQPVPQPAEPAAQTTPAKAPSSITVTYTDSGFSPATVTIPKGGAVVFKNAASDGVWVASNPHPIHNGYPTTGGCARSTFDSCKSIPPGGSWSFVFTFVGSWRYHNHLNPGEGGTVIVR